MPKNKRLLTLEKGRALAYCSKCISVSRLASELDRSLPSLRTFCAMKRNTIAKIWVGGHHNFRGQTKKLIREASVRNTSSLGFVNSLRFNVSPRLVRRVLRGGPFLCYD